MTVPLPTQQFASYPAPSYPVSQNTYSSQQYAYHTIQYAPTTQYTQYAPAYSTQYASSPYTSPSQYTTTYATVQPPQYIQISTPTNAQFQASSIVPAQVFQPQFSNQVSSNGSAYQQTVNQYQYLYQYPQQIVKAGQV